jgi:hypothetical protein
LHPWQTFLGFALIFLGFSTDVAHAFDRQDFPLRIYIDPELHGDGFRKPLDPLVREELRRGVADWPRILATEKDTAQKFLGTVLRSRDDAALTDTLLTRGFLRLVDAPDGADLVIEVADHLPGYSWESGYIHLRSRWQADPRHRLGRLQLALFTSVRDRLLKDITLNPLFSPPNASFTPLDDAMDLRLVLVRELGILLGLRIPLNEEKIIYLPSGLPRAAGYCNLTRMPFLPICRDAGPVCAVERSDVRCFDLYTDQIEPIEEQLNAEPGKGPGISSVLRYQQIITSEVEEITLLVAGAFDGLGCLEVQVAPVSGKVTDVRVLRPLKDPKTEAAIAQRVRETVFTPVPPLLAEPFTVKVFLPGTVVSNEYQTNLERQVTDRFASLVPKGKSTRLLLRLADSGALVSAKVLESTGDARLDATLLERLRTLAPFAPLDLRYRERYTEVRLEGRAESALP